jgi:hypothetical protein
MSFDLFLGIPKHRVPEVVEKSRMMVNLSARQTVNTCFRIVKDWQKVVHTKKKGTKLLPNSFAWKQIVRISLIVKRIISQA